MSPHHGAGEVMPHSLGGVKRSPEVDAYVAAVPEGRAAMVRSLRDTCVDELDGFTERIEYRMPAYARDGESEIAFANQKQYVSFYVRPDLVAAHRDQLADLDVGKSCIRFKRPDQLDLDLVRSLLRATVDTPRPID